MPPKKQRLINLPGQKTLFNFSLRNSKDDNNNPVDTNTNTAIDKSTDHGDDINPDKMKVKCQNRTIKLLKPKVKGLNTVNIQVSEKLWPWLNLNENKMFCKVCMKAGKKNTMTIGCTTFTTEKCM